MKTVLVGAFTAFAFSFPLPSAAAPAPQPRIEFTLYNTQTQLRSLSGETLALTLGGRRHGLNARSYSEHAMFADDLPDAPLDSRSHVEARLGSGYAQLTVDDILGNMHAVLGFTSPSPGWSTSDFGYNSNIVFRLPAQSVLTMTGQIAVRADAPLDRNWVSFERGLIAAAEGTFADRFVFDRWAPQEYFSITATNPLDEEATFYFYSFVGGVAFNVFAVPEPARVATMTGGLLLLGALYRRMRRPRCASSPETVSMVEERP